MKSLNLLLFSLATAIFSSCGCGCETSTGPQVNNRDTATFYYNVNCIVEEKIQADHLSVIARNAEKPQLAMKYEVSEKQFAKFGVGDTMKFDFLRKDRFFDLPRREIVTSKMILEEIRSLKKSQDSSNKIMNNRIDYLMESLSSIQKNLK